MQLKVGALIWLPVVCFLQKLYHLSANFFQIFVILGYCIKSVISFVKRCHICLLNDKFAELGKFDHTCQEDIICMNICGKIPYFNAPVYFENKQQIGVVDEVFGTIMENVSVSSFTFQPT